jgi:spermidine/putrescine transport system permease protein
VFIPILGEYLTPELVGGTRGVMIGNLVDNFFEEAQYATGAAIALLIVVVVLILLVIFRRSLVVGQVYGR